MKYSIWQLGKIVGSRLTGGALTLRDVGEAAITQGQPAPAEMPLIVWITLLFQWIPMKLLDSGLLLADLRRVLLTFMGVLLAGLTVSTRADPSTIVGSWNLTFAWAGSTPRSGTVTFDPSGTFTTDDGYSGSWSLTGSSITWTFTSGARYSGTVSSANYMSGTMVSSTGLTGTWSATQPQLDSYEPDNTPETAEAITNGQTQNRSINPLGDQDWVTFTIGSQGATNVRLETAGASGDTVMSLYGPNSSTTQIAFSDDKSSSDRFSLITLTNLAPGTYYARVQAYQNNSVIAAYTLTASWSNTQLDSYEPDNTPETAEAITNGQTQNRSINPLGDQDWVTFTIGSQGATNVRLETAGASGDTVMSLYGPNSSTTQIAFSDDKSSSDRFSLITLTNLAPGTYYVRVQAYQNNSVIGAYTLTASWMDGPPPTVVRVLGTWNLAYSWGGSPSGNTTTITFNSGGTFTTGTGGSGSWSLLGSAITWTFSNGTRYSGTVSSTTYMSGTMVSFDGSSGTWIATANTSRLVRVVNASGSQGGAVSVPIELVALGNENALGFSLSFSPADLVFGGAALGNGANGGQLLLQTNQISTGRLGISLALAPAQVFVAGTQQLAMVTFTIRADTTNNAIPLSFRDQPVPREIDDAAANSLLTAYVDGTIGVTSGLEADVSPRPNGNGTLTLADWVQVGRFYVGLDTPASGSEFQRADCAPRATLGNGVITLADWVQAGRYYIGMDPPTPAGGPTAPITTALTGAGGGSTSRSESLARTTTAARTLRILITQGSPGTMIIVPVAFVSTGDENALGFSLSFDPERLTFEAVTLGSGAAGGTLLVATKQVEAGRVGITVAQKPGQSFAAGNLELVRVAFAAGGTAGATAVNFGDAPLAREVVDLAVNDLAANYGNGTVALAPPVSPTGPVFLTLVPSADGACVLHLRGPVGQSFELQRSSDLVSWHTLTHITLTTGTAEYADAGAAGHSRGFYRTVPVSAAVISPSAK